MPIGNGGIIGPANVPTITTASGVWSLREQQQAQGRGAWPLALAPDPYFEYTTLLLPGNGTNGQNNNTFLDGSTNNFPITRNGNTTQGTFSPFSQTGWGNFNPDSSNGIGVATNTALNMGTGDFTVEAWVNTAKLPTTNAFQTTSGGYQAVFGTGPNLVSTGSQLYIGVTNLFFDIASDGGGPINVAHNMVAGQWYHVAISRSGTTFRAFINGVLVQTATSSASWADGYAYGIMRAEPIGGYNGAWWYGYVSNFRLTKGGALYTANFTPSVTPLTTTVSAGTVSLLTCQSNRFIDNSTNNFTITINGSPSVVAFSPFNPTLPWSAATNGGSGYFDGSGDYLSVADNTNLRFGTNAFTIQTWVYRNASGAAHSIIAKGGASTGYVLQITSTNVLRFTHGTTNVDTTTTIPASAWTHVAAVRTNTSTNGFQLYINGVSSATATVATDFNQTDTLYIGSDRSAANVMNGYISGLKYTNGTAESISVPTEPPTATTNVALLTNYTNAGIYDATSKNDLETVGNAQISTSVSKFGGGSIAFDGTGSPTDSLLAPASQNLTFGSGDFTIEMWIYSGANATTTRTMGNIAGGTWSSGKWVFATATPANPNKFTFAFNNYGTDIVSTTSSNDSAWHHVAISRSGSSIRLFVDGNLQATGISSASLDNGVAAALTIGGSGGAGEFWAGYIDDLRITKGYARYTANFTPPTAAFPTL